MTDAVKSSEQTGKRPRRGCLTCGCLVLVVLCAGLAAAPKLVPTEWIGKAVVAEVNRRTGRQCELKNISIGWLDGVTLEGFSLPDADGSELFSCKKISLDANLLKLMVGSMEVKQVTVDGASVSLKKEQDGAWNFEKLLASTPRQEPQRKEILLSAAAETGETGGASLRIENVHVTDSTIRIISPRDSMDMTWRADSLEITGTDINQPMKLEGLLQHLSSGDTLGNIRLAGSVDLLENNCFDPNGASDIALTLEKVNLPTLFKASGFAPGQVIGSGEASGKIKITMESGKPMVHSEGVIFSALSAKLPQLEQVTQAPDTSCAFTAAIDLEKWGLELRGISLKSDIVKAEISANGTIYDFLTTPRATLTIAGNLSLEEIGSFLRAQGITEAISKGARGTAAFSGTVDFTEKNLEAALVLPSGDFEILDAAGGKYARAALGGNLSVGFSPEKIVASFKLENSSLRIESGALGGTAKLEKINGGAQAVYAGGRLAVAAILQNATLIPPSASGEISGTVDGQATFDSASGVVQVKGMNLSLPTGKLSVLGKASSLAEKPVGEFSLAGELDFSKLRALLPENALPKNLATTGKGTVTGKFVLAGNAIKFEQMVLQSPDLRVTGGFEELSNAEISPLRLLAKGEYGVTSGEVKCELLQLSCPSLNAGLTLNANLNSGEIRAAYRGEADRTSLGRLVYAFTEGDVSFAPEAFSGKLWHKRGALTLQDAQISGRMSDGSPCSLGHDLTLDLSHADRPSLNFKELIMKVGSEERMAVAAVLRNGNFAWPDAGAAEFSLTGDLATWNVFAENLRKDVPALRNVAGIFAELYLSGKMRAEGKATLQGGNWHISCQQHTEKFAAAGKDGKSFFQAETFSGGGNVLYAKNGSIKAEGISLAVNGDGLVLNDGSLNLLPESDPAMPEVINWRVAQGSGASITVRDAVKLGNAFPSVADSGLSLSGAATSRLNLEGDVRKLSVAFVADFDKLLACGKGEGKRLPLLLNNSKLSLTGNLNLRPDQVNEQLARNAYGYMHEFTISDGRMQLGEFMLDETAGKNLQSEFKLENGVLSFTKAGMDFAGPVALAGNVVFDSAAPLCDFVVKVDGMSLDHLPQIFEKYADVKHGLFYFPDPKVAPSQRMQWRGFGFDEISRSFTLDNGSFVITDFQFTHNAGDQILSLFGVIGKIYDKSREREENLEEVESITASFFAKDGLVNITTIQAIGKTTADFRMAGRIMPGGILDVRGYINGHVIRAFNVDDLIAMQGGKLAGLSQKEREDYKEQIPEILEKLGQEKKLKFYIQGPIMSPTCTGGEKMIQTALFAIGKDKGFDILINKLLDKTGGSDEKKEKQKENIKDLLKNLKF
jgi:hypothetical protein